MLLSSYINKLLETKSSKKNKDERGIVSNGDSVSFCKVSNHVLITKQPISNDFPGQCFLYRKEGSIWILEYRAFVYELISGEGIDDFTIDAWIQSEGNEFIIKVCNKSQERNGITFTFKLFGDLYKIIDISKNDRIEVAGREYHI